MIDKLIPLLFHIPKTNKQTKQKQKTICVVDAAIGGYVGGGDGDVKKVLLVMMMTEEDLLVGGCTPS